MRQAGLVAAAGLFALRKHSLLKEDQRRALVLAQGLKDVNGISLMDEIPPSNMVYLNLDPKLSLDAVQMKAKLRKKGSWVGSRGETADQAGYSFVDYRQGHRRCDRGI